MRRREFFRQFGVTAGMVGAAAALPAIAAPKSIAKIRLATSLTPPNDGNLYVFGVATEDIRRGHIVQVQVGGTLIVQCEEK